MPHRADYMKDLVNLIDAIHSEIREAKRQVDSVTAMDLVEIKRLINQLKDEVKALRKKRR